MNPTGFYLAPAAMMEPYAPALQPAGLDADRYCGIEAYAVIGDGHTAALVSRAGSIDWWCPGRFDAPSVFAAMLDAGKGGRFSLAPVAAHTVSRRYVGLSNVLETTFTCESGILRLTDLMPLDPGDGILRARGSILRIAECTAGQVEIEVLYEPRPGYGRSVPGIRERPGGVFVCSAGAGVLGLVSECSLRRATDGTRLYAWSWLKAGDRRSFALCFASGEPLVFPGLGEGALRQAQETADGWKEWASRCAYDGPYRDAVLRSALVLKLLIYAPSGALVAAPTTSLPEEVGGVRNWDYRYCWLRDAGMSVRALMGLGYTGEASAYLGWLTHATNLTWPRLKVLYTLFGGSPAKETPLGHLEGYRGSRPAQTGNGAADQVQLDIYGEVVGAAYEFVRGGGQPGRRTLGRLVEVGEQVCRLWKQPDSGLWEIRSGPAHHTYSKVMCWAVLDRLLSLHRAGKLKVPESRFEAERDAIRESIEAEGFSEAVGSYVQAAGGCVPDASLLLLPVHGYVDARAPRMRSTFEFLRSRLERGGLWYRYPPGTGDGLPGKEGAFGPCAFWAAEYLARRGDQDAATAAFEDALAYANDVGLFAEEVDPADGGALGNMPQAFTHVALINAALALEESRSGRPAAFSDESTKPAL